MNYRKQRLARLRSLSQSRSRSRSRSRSHTPDVRTGQRPSTARRALLMGLTLEKPEREVEADMTAPPAKRLKMEALSVERTPRGSLNIRGKVLAERTPGGHVKVLHGPLPPPLCADVLERVEAMDLSEEEVEEVLQDAPWHVKRWISEIPDSPVPSQLSPRTSAEVNLGNASGIVSSPTQEPSNAGGKPKITSADADVRPSTSGMMPTSRPVTKSRNGSDLDSEFDDEFDFTMEGTGAKGIERDIPDDEELDEPVREIVGAVQRAMDNEFDRMAGLNNRYDWVEDFDLFRGRPETFSGPTPGPVKDYDTPYDAFREIWSEDFIDLIVRESNRYASQTIEKKRTDSTLKDGSRLHRWKPTDADEILVLFGVFMYMGIDPRTSINEYWKTNCYLEMPKFRQIMPYHRYVLLSRCLHFVDNSDESQIYLQSEGTKLSKRVAKLAPVITHLNSKFASIYNLQKNIAIDESLTLFKGRLSWVQTIRTKAARFGIKSFELCESQTGYLFRFQIYTGAKDSEGDSTNVAPSEDLGGKSAKVVLELLKGLEHQGHCLTMDNYYNSPALARYLKSRGFDCLGTLRLNRKNVSVDLSKIPKNVAKGTITARHCGDVSIIAWKDSKVVPVISTSHNADTYLGSKAGKPLVKPICVRDYNGTMGGVDLKDQKLSLYLLERKRCVKWYIKMFKRLMNASIHNAYILYVNSAKRRNVSTMTHREFRFALAKSLVEGHRSTTRPAIREPTDVMRLRKDIVHVPQMSHGKKNRVRKRCVVCYRQGENKVVVTVCETCDVFLCFGNCWLEWHSLTKLKGKEIHERRRTRKQ